MLKKLIAATLAFSFPFATSFAGVQQEVRFAKGSSGSVIEGAVLRGERDFYTIGARGGQFLSLQVESMENNAVFDVYLPGARKVDDTTINGSTVAGAKEVTKASMQLPTNGTYLIVVGGTRGNAQYRLSISITNTAPQVGAFNSNPPAPSSSTGLTSVPAPTPRLTATPIATPSRQVAAIEAAPNSEASIAARLKTKPIPLALVAQYPGIDVYENVEMKYAVDQHGENPVCYVQIGGTQNDGKPIVAKKFLLDMVIAKNGMKLISANFFGTRTPLRIFVDGSKEYVEMPATSPDVAVLALSDRMRNSLATAKTLKISHGQGASGEIAFIYDFSNFASILRVTETLCAK